MWITYGSHMGWPCGIQMHSIWYPSGVSIWYPCGKHMGPIWVAHMETIWGPGCKPHHLPDGSHMAKPYGRHMGVIWLCYWGRARQDRVLLIYFTVLSIHCICRCRVCNAFWNNKTRQGGVLSPVLFAVYVNDIALSESGAGCYYDNMFVGCVICTPMIFCCYLHHSMIYSVDGQYMLWGTG